MKFYGFLVLTLTMGFASVHAQHSSTSFEVDHYKHSVSDTTGKITFNLQPTGSILKFTQSDKWYCWYSNNKIRSTQGGFSGKLLHGQYNEFYVNKNLKAQGNFEMGVKVGSWKQWNENGMLLSDVKYTKGLLDGIFFRYSPEGKLIESGYYLNGLLNGQVKRYINADSVTLVRYKKGIIVSKKEKGKSWAERLLSNKKNIK